ncbi:hypothetical protein B9G55_13920 [Saccharibacillus sp. O16]|nr:hypothetical protein B9G55_13920 [Saccharibacillus sp. O16]
MKIEQELRSALQKKTSAWEVPEEVLHNVTAQIGAEQTAAGSRYVFRRQRPVRKRILVGVISAVLILPTGAYAGYHYLTDAIYGSSENQASFGGNLNQYERLEAKLQTMKSQMSESEYEHLTGLLREAADLSSPYRGANGQLETKKMSAEELNKMETLEREIKEATAGLNTVEGAETQVGESFSVDDFWAEVFEQAKEKLTSEEYAEFEKLAEKQRTLERETDDATMEQLNAYLSRLGGHRIEITK